MTGWLETRGRGGAERVPFTLLGGYLGAGKTTIVNHVLAHAGGRRLVVLVNDVGAVNVDAALISEHDGPTLTLTNGCVCCSIDGDFVSTLESVRELPERPDHVLMELSGVGEPARLAAWANTTGFRLDGVVVAVDGEQFPEQLDRRYVGDTVAEQVRSADLLVLTKSDLAGEERTALTEERLAALSHAPVVRVVDGAVPVDLVLGIGGSPSPSVGDDRHHPGVVTSTVDLAGLDRPAVEALLAALPDRVVRAKGLARLADGVHEIQVVGRRHNIRPRPDLDCGRDVVDDRLVVIELAR